MGRQIKATDIQIDLGILLRESLKLADSIGLHVTAARLALALDQYELETGVQRTDEDDLLRDAEAAQLEASRSNRGAHRSGGEAGPTVK